MGNPCWLEMAVATEGGGTLTMLAPGQALLPSHVSGRQCRSRLDR
jgi:hypothetical protein